MNYRAFWFCLALLSFISPLTAQASEVSCTHLFEAKDPVVRDPFKGVESKLKTWSEISPIFDGLLKRGLDQVARRSALRVNSAHFILPREDIVASYRALGISINRRFGSGEIRDITSPPVVQIFEKYEKAIDQLIRRHPQYADHTIRPRFTFFNPTTKEWLFLRHQDEIPAGYFLYEKLTPGVALYEALANGFFPVSVLAETIVQHDLLGHLTTFLAHPEYAKNYRALAQQIRDGGGWRDLKKRPSQAWRVFYANENLVLLPKGKLLTLLKALSLTGRFRTKVDLNRVKDKVTSLNLIELDRLMVNTQLKLSTRALDLYGGAVRDPHHAIRFNPFTSFTTEYGRNESLQHRQKIFLRLLETLEKFQALTLEEFFSHAARTSIDETSEIYELFCSGRFFPLSTSSQTARNGFCTNDMSELP